MLAKFTSPSVQSEWQWCFAFQQKCSAIVIIFIWIHVQREMHSIKMCCYFKVKMMWNPHTRLKQLQMFGTQPRQIWSQIINTTKRQFAYYRCNWRWRIADSINEIDFVISSVLNWNHILIVTHAQCDFDMVNMQTPIPADVTWQTIYYGRYSLIEID